MSAAKVGALDVLTSAFKGEAGGLVLWLEPERGKGGEVLPALLASGKDPSQPLNVGYVEARPPSSSGESAGRFCRLPLPAPGTAAGSASSPLPTDSCLVQTCGTHIQAPLPSRAR